MSTGTTVRRSFRGRTATEEEVTLARLDYLRAKRVAGETKTYYQYALEARTPEEEPEAASTPPAPEEEPEAASPLAEVERKLSRALASNHVKLKADDDLYKCCEAQAYRLLDGMDTFDVADAQRVRIALMKSLAGTALERWCRHSSITNPRPRAGKEMPRRDMDWDDRELVDKVSIGEIILTPLVTTTAA